MLDEFSATIEKIYAAAAEPALWPEALRAVEDFTGSTGAVLNLVPKLGNAPPMCLAGSFSQEDCAEYAQDYMWRCPRIAFGEEHPEVPIHFDRMILSETEMDRDPTYEWFGRHGLRYYVAGWIGESSSHRAHMSLQRSRRQGHVDSEHVQQFALVVKHMAQALALAVKLGTLDQQCQLGLAMLQSLPHAVFVLDGDGGVLVTNRRADALIAKPDQLAIVDGRLHCAAATEQSQLDKLVRAAIVPEPHAPRGGWMRIARPCGSPYVVFVSQFLHGEALFSSFEPKVLVIVSDSAHAAVLDEQILQSVYQLTQTESRIANAIASGHSVESAAAVLNMQVATARSHLKSIFAKVGVHRQQDLVRVLTSLSSMRP